MNCFWCDIVGCISVGCISYDSKEHAQIAWKFLYWDTEKILLVGSRSLETHQELHREARRTISIPNRDPDGAGDIDFGEITSWESIGYEVVTPEDLKPKILNALGMPESEIV